MFERYPFLSNCHECLWDGLSQLAEARCWAQIAARDKCISWDSCFYFGGKGAWLMRAHLFRKEQLQKGGWNGSCREQITSDLSPSHHLRQTIMITGTHISWESEWWILNGETLTFTLCTKCKVMQLPPKEKQQQSKPKYPSPLEDPGIVN